MSENRKIIKGATLVGGLTALSRVLGLLRDMVIARFFGASLAADAFFVAFRIPNVLRRLFAEGALTVTFIPVFKETELKEGREKAKEITDVVFTFLTCILALVTVAGIIFAPFIVRLIAPGFDAPEKYELTVYLTRIIFPYIFFIGLVALAMGVLNSVGHFAAPAAAPVLLNVAIIGATFLLSPRLDEPVTALAIGVIIGGILQVLLQLRPLRKAGYLPGIRFDLTHPVLRKLGRLMAPALFGIAVYQLNIFISTIIASFLPEGSVSYLYYADRFFQLPLGIFVISMATVVLPTLSDQVATGRLEEMRDSLSFSLRVIFFITLPATAGLIALSEPVFSLFFQRGAFDHHATLQSAIALRYYALGLFVIGGVKIIVPAFYAMQDMKTPVRAAFGAFVANIALSLLLMGPLLHGGLALATTLSALLNLAILLLLLKPKVGVVIDRPVVVSFFRSLAASILTGVVAYLVCLAGDWQVDGINGNKLVVVAAAVMSGVAVYIVASLLMKSDETAYVLKALKEKVRRQRGTAES